MSARASFRISDKAYQIAKERAKSECVTICEWISKAIIEKAILDDLTEDQEE